MKKSKPYTKNSIRVKKKIRRLCNLIDKRIDKHVTSDKIHEWFKLVSDRDLVTAISKGGFINDECLEKLFKKYGIK